MLQSVALMFTIQVGGLDVDETSKLGGQLGLRKTISSRKVSCRSQDVQGLELGMKAGKQNWKESGKMRGGGGRGREERRREREGSSNIRKEGVVETRES